MLRGEFAFDPVKFPKVTVVSSAPVVSFAPVMDAFPTELGLVPGLGEEIP